MKDKRARRHCAKDLRLSNTHTGTGSRSSPDVVLRSGDQSADQVLAQLLQDRGWRAVATPSLDDAVDACCENPDFSLCVVHEQSLERLVDETPPILGGQTIVMALLARPSSISAISAFNRGAHVLLPLPLDAALFIAQVEALLGRLSNRSVHFFGGFELDPLGPR